MRTTNVENQKKWKIKQGGERHTDRQGTEYKVQSYKPVLYAFLLYWLDYVKTIVTIMQLTRAYSN